MNSPTPPPSQSELVVVVGELNPYGVDPRYALFDLPKRASGYRLRTKVMGIERRTYFEFRRHNLCKGKWDTKEAEREAARLYLDVYDSRRVRATFILLGQKVAAAFGHRAVGAFTRDESMRLVFLPHPSGLNCVWNEPGAYERARALLSAALPAVPWGEALDPQTSDSHPRGTGDSEESPVR